MSIHPCSNLKIHDWPYMDYHRHNIRILMMRVTWVFSTSHPSTLHPVYLLLLVCMVLEERIRSLRATVYRSIRGSLSSSPGALRSSTFVPQISRNRPLLRRDCSRPASHRLYAIRMAGSDDDEDLKAAIALSLADQAPSWSGASSIPNGLANRRNAQSSYSPDFVDLSKDPDDSDDELVPICKNLRTSGPTGFVGTNSGILPETSKSSLLPRAALEQPDIETMTVNSSLQSLNRKKMEEERLARLKRKASISPPDLRRETQQARTAKLSQQRTVETMTGPVNTENSGTPTLSFTASSSVQSISANSGIQFPHGVVRKTWAFGFTRNEDIKIEEVLQKNDLNIAVLSAFQWDVEWLMRKLDLSKTKMIFVMQAKDENTVSFRSLVG